MSADPLPWLAVRRGEAPLVVSIPHAGTIIPAAIEARLVSPWRARVDADWWIDRLYGFAGPLGATVVSTALSRTVVDVNRDPSGASLYPGRATTELCPTTTFDGDPLYRTGAAPGEAEIADWRARWFDPYHAALRHEIGRLRAAHGRVVVYDCHSIRSVIPRLFEGTLPHLNVGTNGGASCDPALEAAIMGVCAAAEPFGAVLNGRFKGGWITRSLGDPGRGVHAVQMELACRGYMEGDEQGPVREDRWPPPYDAARAAPIRPVLERVVDACLAFTRRA